MARKKHYFIVILLAVILICVFYFGNLHSNNVITQQAKEAKQAEQQALAKKQAEINKLKPSVTPRSYDDDIRYFKAIKDKVVVSTLGSSVTAGTGSTNGNSWSSLLQNYLENLDGGTSITFNNNGFGGYSTEDIIKNNKVDLVISQKPDMVLFETCLLNDHGKGIPIQKTEQNISFIVNKIHSALPQTRIILLSPNPRRDESVTNKDRILLSEYVSKTNAYILANNWNYIDIYDGFKERNADMSKLLVDAVHPNNDGYKIWFEIIKSEFEKKK